VLKPGMRLRVLYMLSIDDSSGGGSDLALAHKGDMDSSYARAPGSASSTHLPPELAHEIEGYRRTVWEVSNNFVLAMAQYPTDSMHLIFTPTDKDEKLQDERFSFFDGLFVGSPNGKVTVIAVEKESYGEQAGLKAGDEILAVGSVPTHGDLTTFAMAYAKTKEDGMESELTSYPLMVLSPGASAPRQVNVPLPPTIKGGLMDGFH
jgi:hypothetical protein